MARIPKNPDAIADVVSFGKKAAELKAARARSAMNMDMTRGIPGAENYARYFDAQTLRDLTFTDPEQAVVGTINPDVINRLYRMYSDTLDDAEKMAIAEDVRTLTDDGTFDVVPTMQAFWNPETKDIEVSIDMGNLSQAEALRTAALAQNAQGGRLPFQLQWAEEMGPPWMTDPDWKHSGRIVFKDEQGGVEHVTSWRDLDFPLDADFKARRDPELEGLWWSEAPVSPWALSSRESLKFQAATDGEVEGMLRSMYSPSHSELFMALRDGGQRQILGRQIAQWANDNYVPDSFVNYNALEAGDPGELTKWLTGEGYPGFNREALETSLRGTRLEGYAKGTADKNFLKNREEGDVIAEQYAAQVYGDFVDQNHYFNGVLDKIQQEDPRRYEQMLKFTEGSPYKQGMLGLPDIDPDRPMLIFHSGRHFDLEGMGYPDVELPTQLWPGEIGTHAGDLPQSSMFASSIVRADVVRDPETGALRRRMAPEVSSSYNENLRNIEVHEKALANSLPPDLMPLYKDVRRRVSEEWLYKLEEIPENPGLMVKPQIGEKVQAEFLRELGLPQFEFADAPEPEELYLVAKALNMESVVKNFEEANDIGGPHGWANKRIALRPVRDLLGYMRNVEQLRYHVAGQTMYPLVFRGKRPFRMLDLTHNSVDVQAQEALNWNGWSDTQRLNLEKLVNDFDMTHKDRVELFRNTLEDAGFDHIVYMNEGEEAGRPSIVFWDQSLAKPLYGSRGFDKNSREWVKSVLATPLFGLGEEEE